MTRKTSQKNAAYTLLEILVVISIIAILIALGAVSYTTAQQKGRDARRKADMKIFQQAYEQYYSANESSYPADSGLIGNDNNYFPGGQPSDPKSGETYTVNTNASGYCICAELESTDGNAGDPGSSAVCNFGTGSFSCVTNLQ